MGITGLIPFLEKASSKINLKEISGCTVAIDTYCWLHKGAIACADKLSRGEDTDMHIKYCLKYVNLLLSYNIRPILVFDGQHLPAKAQTESKRREIRKNSKKRAAELLRMGKIEEARSQMRRSIDITHEMALQLIKMCRKMNVDCIVAPYEADAQIAFFSINNIAQYVITEDSDLTLFGCKKIIFKLDLVGNGLLVDSDKFHVAMGCRLEKYTIDKFRYMCILSGCDYLDSLPGIGLAKACKFILMTEETDIKRALTKIPAYLNMRNLIVTDDYIENFLKADATFKHMFVFDPSKRKMVRLNELSEFNTNIEYCSNAGHQLDNKIAFDLALGNLNPFTLKRLDDWNPDIHFSKLKSQRISKQIKSIWIGNVKSSNLKPKTNDIRCALTFKKINLKPPQTQTSAEEDGSSEIEVISLYSTASNELNRKRPRTRSDSSDSDSSLENSPKNRIISPETPKKNTHNPFASPPSDKFSLENCKNSSSLLKIISPSKKNSEEKSNTKIVKQIVKSRLFASNHMLLKPNVNDNNQQEEAMIINSDDIIDEIKELHEQKKTETSLYISSPEMIEKSKSKIENNTEESFNNTFVDNDEINNSQNIEIQNDNEITNVIDVDNYYVGHSSSKKFPSNKIKSNSGLMKPKKKQQKQNVPDKSQSRLSMFGFKKRSTLNHNS